MLINNGKIVADAPIDELSNTINGGGVLSLEVAGSTAVIRTALSSVPGVKRVTKGAGNHYTVEHEAGVDVRRDIFNALANENCPILMMQQGGLSLEESFLKLTEGGDA